MAKIYALSPIVANQIAAGEVIERPASVLKELLENSIDAKSTHIDIEILQGGLSLIKLTDDGEGIDKEDLPLSLLRHATSKVRTMEDLSAIHSLGFRGEALASIASVAKCKVSSKPREQSEGWGCEVRGDALTPYLFPTAPYEGTIVEVQDLFYNTPARRKFLKSSRTELNHIEHVVKCAALSHPEIGFTLTHNEKVIKTYAKTSDLARRVQQIVGVHFIQHAFYIDINHCGFHFYGWLGTQEAFRKSTDLQYFFLNQRPIRDKIINHAIKKAFFDLGLSLEGEVASFVLYLECPFSEVDINVHPTKHEVRFSDPTWVHDFIQTGIKKVIEPRDKEKVVVVAKKTVPMPVYSEVVVEERDEQPSLSFNLEVYKPKAKGPNRFWQSFYMGFKETLFLIDLDSSREFLWRVLCEESEQHPWPTRMSLFPTALSPKNYDLKKLAAWGFVIKPNIQDTLMLTETPAFLSEENLQKVIDLLKTKPVATHLQNLLDFFTQLPWQIFTQHAFFEERFDAWCGHRRFTFIREISKDNLKVWLEDKEDKRETES